jgi:hypothetical protein
MSSDARDEREREGRGKSIRGDYTEIGVWSTEYHRIGFLFLFSFHVDILLFYFLLFFFRYSRYSLLLLIILCAYEALDVYSSRIIESHVI